MTLINLNLVAILPLIITGLTVVVLMLAIAWRRCHGMSAAITVVGLLIAFVSVFCSARLGPVDATTLLRVDGFSSFYTALTLIVTIVVAIFAANWLKTYPDNKEEFYLLLTIAALGGIVLSSAAHMASLFIGIELLSLPLFGLIGYAYRQSRALEASIKYMLLSAAASAFLLFGIALLYAATGHLSFIGLASSLHASATLYPILLLGVGLMVVGLGFKLSLAPFQLWTPDVYQGAPAPVSMFLATVGKLAVFAVLTRFCITTSIIDSHTVQIVLAFIAFISIIFGNVLAISQRNVKRMLAYSSVAHLGYLLVAIVAFSQRELALESIGIYLVGYLLSSIATFGVVCLRSGTYTVSDKELVEDYRGLFWRRPVLAISMMIVLFSLAGIPVTFGFIGKFYIVALAATGQWWWLVAAVVIGSALGLYYYLRLAVNLFYRPEDEAQECCSVSGCRCCQGIGQGIILVCAALIVIFGIFPQPLISLVRLAFPM